MFCNYFIGKGPICREREGEMEREREREKERERAKVVLSKLNSIERS